MRSKIDAKAFVQALDKVSDLIRKSSIPALNGVLLQFEWDCCTMTSTNLESYLSIKLPAQGDRFSCLLGRPKETVRAFRQFDGELLLEQTETGEGDRRRIKLALSCGPRSAALPVFLPEDFPVRPACEQERTFSANAASLHTRVERVSYAAAPPSQEKSRPCQFNVQFSGSCVYAVDGYRMAWDVDDGLSVPAPFMAPPAALDYLKLFGDQEVGFHLGERWAKVTDGEITLIFHRPEGELFQPDKVIPARFQTEFYVSPKEFLGELGYLKRALKGKGPYLVRFSGGSLYAASQGEQYATKVTADGSEFVLFGFNLRFMEDALGQFKQEPWVKMKCGSHLSPIVLEAEGRSDYAMVLPVRFNANSMAA